MIHMILVTFFKENYKHWYINFSDCRNIMHNTFLATRTDVKKIS